MTLAELITDLKAAGANENTIKLALNCYELGKAEAQRKPLTWEQQMRIHNECGDSVSLAIALTEAAHGIKEAA